MKVFNYIILFAIVFTSCKSAKNATNNNVISTSSKKVIKKYTASLFDRKTVDAKLKFGFQNSKEKVDFSVRMKIRKDEVIWMKGTKLITVFKAKITPEKVSFYSPYKKNYIEGDFNTLKEILGFKVDFYQLQNLLMGETLYDVNTNKHNISTIDNSYILTPKKQPTAAFDVMYKINQLHYKLNEQNLINSQKQQRLDILYPKYKKTDSTLFPEHIKINTKQKTKASSIDISVRSVIFDEEITIPYQIPQGYKEIKL